MQHLGAPCADAHAGELHDPRHRVEPVTAQELRRRLDRTACPLVLVAPVLPELRLAREVEVEVRRPPRRAGRAREDDAQDVRVLVLGDERPEAQQVVARRRCVPRVDVRRRSAGLTFTPLEARERVPHLALEHERIVRLGLHAHQQAVEGRDVDAGRVQAAFQSLDQRRPGAGERIEHVLARPEVAAEQLLHIIARDLRQVGARMTRRRGILAGFRQWKERIELLLDGAHAPPAAADLRQ